MKRKTKALLCLSVGLGILVGCEKGEDVSLSSFESSTQSSDSSANSSNNEKNATKILMITRYGKMKYIVGESFTMAAFEVKLFTIVDNQRDDGVVIDDYLTNIKEGATLNQVGAQTVTVSMEDSSVISTSFEITIEKQSINQAQEVRKLKVSSEPTTKNYFQGEKFDSTGLIVAEEIYVDGTLSSTNPVDKEDYELVDPNNKVLHDGDTLSDFNSRYRITVRSTKTNVKIESTYFDIVIEESEQTNPSLPDVKKVFNTLKSAKNYTFTVTDTYRNMTLTKTWDEKSYYFDSSKDYFGHFGYAEANNQVFKYTLEGGNVIADIPSRIDGEVVQSLYGGGLVSSFTDVDMEHLPTTIATGNTYRLDMKTNEKNILLFADLFNYGDVLSLDEVEAIMITVTGQNTLRIRLTAEFMFGSYTFTGDVSKVSETKNEAINKYLEEGKGAKKLNDIPEKYLSEIKKIQEGKNYTMTAQYFGASASDGEPVKKEDFVDRFTENACYTDDKLNPQYSGGYANYIDNIFSYTIDGDLVIAGDIETDAYGNTYHSLYESVNSLLDFDLFAMDTEEKDGKLFVRDSKNIDVILRNIARTTFNNYGSLVEEAYLTFTENNKLELDVKLTSGGYAKGVVSEVGTTKIPEIEKYLDAGNGPNQNTSLTNLKAIVEAMKSAKNYTEDMGYADGGKHIGYTHYMEHAVYVEYVAVERDDYGFIDYDGSIYEFTVKEEGNKKTLVLGSVAKSNTSLAQTKIYPTSLSIFNNTDALQYSSVNGYFMTDDQTITGEVCDFMGMSDYKDTYIPYGAGFAAVYDEENINNSTLKLGYFVTTSSGQYGRFENTYSNFNQVHFDFIEEFLKK